MNTNLQTNCGGDLGNIPHLILRHCTTNNWCGESPPVKSNRQLSLSGEIVEKTIFLAEITLAAVCGCRINGYKWIYLNGACDQNRFQPYNNPLNRSTSLNHHNLYYAYLFHPY